VLTGNVTFCLGKATIVRGAVSSTAIVALKRISPRSAAGKPSQCCSNVARNDATSPAASKEISSTWKLPESVLQPRPSPETLRPGSPAPMNGHLLATG
jgi:hypothetical protein